MRLLPLLFLGFTLCCVGGRQNTKTSLFSSEPLTTVEVIEPAKPADSALAMMDTTVQVHVDIKATMFRENEETGQTETKEIDDGWVGSGVVYENDGKTSKILSANHVLETPAVGSVEDVKINFLGMELNLGKKRIDSVKITVTTNQGRTCNVKPLVLGVSDYRDVATAEVDCDAGRVAKIGHATPAQGEKVFVSGHPLGVPLPMVTEGYVSGIWNLADDEEDLGKFLLVSAGAYGGNSGGPVFHNGEVIGLLVRGSRAYPNISLVTPLEQVLLRLADTP
jgi:S1-C subfamily serine protease